MNKMRKLSALICAGALVMTSVVPAWAAQISSSDGAVENMGEQGVSFDSIQLPAIADGTYDFTLDPEKLLKTYGGAAYAAADSTFIFTATDAVATLTYEKGTAPNVTDEKVYYQTKAAATNLTGLEGALEVVDSKVTGFKTAATNKEFYVYIPDRSSEQTIEQARGKYELIVPAGDNANLEKYFTVTYPSDTTVTLTFKGDKELDLESAVPNVCNGKLYTNSWTQLTEDFDKYVTIAADGTVTINEGVTLSAMKSDGTTPLDIDASKIIYKEATTKKASTSEKVKIVNKSSKDKTVKVKVNVTNGDGLEFADDATKAAALDKTKASVFLRISNGTAANDVYVKKNTVDDVNTYSAVAAFDVDGVDTTVAGTVETYMAGVDEKTGGHIFNAYLNPVADTAYSNVEFTLQGGAVDVAGIADADEKKAAQGVWNAYAESLRSASTVIKPGVTVVYDIKDKVDKVTGTETALTGEVSFNDDGTAWFDLGTGVKPEEATDVQLVATTDGSEDVYALKLSDCGMDGTWMGVPYDAAGDAETLTVLVKIDTKVYKQQLW